MVEQFSPEDILIDNLSFKLKVQAISLIEEVCRFGRQVQTSINLHQVIVKLNLP